MTTPTSKVKPSKTEWFIHDQAWSWLDMDPSLDPKPYLSPARMRAGQTRDIVELDLHGIDIANSWRPIRDRDAVALNKPSKMDPTATELDFQFIVFTSDAGIGKTKTTEWLEYRINQPDSQQMAFRFDLRRLVADIKLNSVAKDLVNILASEWSCVTEKADSRQPLSVDNAKKFIEAFARQGRLCLLFDGLDQASGEDVIKLSAILDSPKFRNCRFVVAGRSHAVITKREALFKKHPWRYIKVEEFSRTQQIRYLGWLDNGEVRYFKIHRAARAILSVPRVLSYLRSETDFKKYLKPADVYYYAIRNILGEGMARSEAPATIGLRGQPIPSADPDKGYSVSKEQVTAAMQLLAITAYESLVRNHPAPTWPDNPSRDEIVGEYEYPYVYNLVRQSSEFGEGIGQAELVQVRNSIKAECERLRVDGNFETNWSGIAALNSQFLDQGIFEDSNGGLDQIVWANRSLHEFLVAYYFSCLAKPEDCKRLWDWITLKDQSATDDYFQFWCFLCEMHFEARLPEVWLRSIELLYQPCQVIGEPNADSPGISLEPQALNVKSAAERQYFAKRSTEMIYRSWQTLEWYAKTKKNAEAQRILSSWLGEFELIRQQIAYGEDRQQTAQDIVDHLLEIPGGEFIMGTLLDKQIRGMPAVRAYLEKSFNEYRQDTNAIKEFFDSYPQSRSIQEFRDRYEKRWFQLADKANKGHADDAFEEYATDLYPANELKMKRSVDSFAIGRRTISNRFYRLFDPGHFQRNSYAWNDSLAFASTLEHSTICINWFDGWVYSKWLHWAGQGCRLPYEDEWEYVAKFGFGNDKHRWHQRYWWGDDFDAKRDRLRIHCLENIKSSSDRKPNLPDKARTNPHTITLDVKQSTGIIDILGNLLEWCMDAMPNPSLPYERIPGDTMGDTMVFRSCRGGSFDSEVMFARCANRGCNVPATFDVSYGLRVARALNQ